jgi:hypothetical protein
MLSSWKTKRTAKQAFMPSGKVYPQSPSGARGDGGSTVSWFIKKAEVEARIKETTGNDAPSVMTRNALQELLDKEGLV